MLLATATIWVMLLDGQVTRRDGLILMAGLAVFLIGAILGGGGEEPVRADASAEVKGWMSWLQTGAGLVILVIGARLLVASATTIARDFGISETVIGLTIVAVGTSLPELATSVIAAWRRQTEISVGNIVGSNIFNIFGILGVTALVASIPSEARFAAVDMPWVAGAAVGLTAIAFLLGGLPRVAGLALLATYGTYLWVI